MIPIDLYSVVDLYRKSGRPDFNDREFSATLPYTSEILELICSLRDGGAAWGSFEDIEVDEESINDQQKLPLSGKEINFSFVLAMNKAERFYKNIKELLNIFSLKKGELPSKYYLVEDDYYSTESIEPKEITNIKSICEIITSLASLAHYHDIRNDSQSYRLVFIKNSDGASTATVIEPEINYDMLTTSSIQTDVIKNLCDKASLSKPHQSEKIGIFRNSLVEYIGDNNRRFPELLSTWDSLQTLYQNNLDVYLSGFSFHKARKDVANAETEIAEKISKITTELTGKIFSIPISLIATFGILKLNDLEGIILLMISIIFTSLVVFLVVRNQEKQFFRLCHAKSLLFKPFESQMDIYPSDLKLEINNANTALNENLESSRKILTFFKFIAWLPSAVAFAILINMYTSLPDTFKKFVIIFFDILVEKITLITTTLHH